MQLNNLSAKLGETELESIIKRAVEAETGLKVSSVTFDVGTRTTGYGQGETTTYTFNGATINFEKSQSITKAK